MDKQFPDDHIDIDLLLFHQLLPETKFSRFMDRVINQIGQFVSWGWLLLLIVVVLNVVMRYVFGEGRIEFEEIQWHIYSIGFLFGLSFSYVADDHVRVDVLRERMTPVTQAWIELYGILLLLLPFLVLIILYGIPFVYYSYTLNEVSEAPGGLSHRWLVKSLLPLGFFLLLLAAVSRLTRLTSFLFTFPRAVSAVQDTKSYDR